MRRFGISLVVALATASSGCYSYSNYQSAKLLRPGKIALAPSASYNSFHDEAGYNGEVDDWIFDAQLRAGIAPWFEFGAKFSSIFVGEGYQFIAIDPKFALSPGFVAFSCPFGAFFGNGISSDLQVHPTLLTTMPIDPGRAEMNAAFKVMLFFFEDETEELLGFNLGPRLSSDLDRWAIQPEIGFLFNPDADGYFFQFGIGFMVSP